MKRAALIYIIGLYHVSAGCYSLLSEGRNAHVYALQGGALYAQLTPVDIQKMQEQAKSLQSQAFSLLRRANPDVLRNCQVWGALPSAIGLWVWSWDLGISEALVMQLCFPCA